MLFAAAGLVTAEVLLRKGLGFVFGSSFVFSVNGLSPSCRTLPGQ